MLIRVIRENVTKTEYFDRVEVAVVPRKDDWMTFDGIQSPVDRVNIAHWDKSEPALETVATVYLEGR